MVYHGNHLLLVVVIACCHVLLICVTRGHFQFKHGYHIRDPLLDSVNLYLANTPLNEKFEEFIDGFLNCMNIDPTF
jgi:hypothetical protein